MARTRSKTQRQSPRPRPAPRRPVGAVRADAANAPAAVAPVADEQWSEDYPHVRRDLVRIAILSVILFAAIFAAPHVF